MNLVCASALCAVLGTVSSAAQDSPPAVPEGAEWTATESGLRYVELEPGKGGPVAEIGDRVSAHYTGWLKADGSKFDSSYDRGAPFPFTVGRGVIKGWSEVIQLMPLGAKWLVEIPPELGYGEEGRGQIPSNATLLFTIEFRALLTPHPFTESNPEASETIEEGLVVEVVNPGEGETCSSEDLIVFHYSLYRPDGSLIESSKQRGEPARAKVDQLNLPVMQKVFPRLKSGMLVRATANKEQGLGQQSPPGVDETVWYFEVVEIVPPLPLPEFETPTEEDSKSSETGLRWVTLREGEGESPKPTDTVSVHYVGRLLDGKVFDSSFSRGETTSFPLNRVISGWTEGVGMMKPGEVRVFVIPGDLAYGAGGSPPDIGPNETLVFYIELVSVGS